MHISYFAKGCTPRIRFFRQRGSHYYEILELQLFRLTFHHFYQGSIQSFRHPFCIGSNFSHTFGKASWFSKEPLLLCNHYTHIRNPPFPPIKMHIHQWLEQSRFERRIIDSIGFRDTGFFRY